jgi:putative isomerase
MAEIDFIELLKNQIDIKKVPFSDRGSRLLVYHHPERHSLYIKLAERLTELEHSLEAYLQRAPFIPDLCLVDENGDELDFATVTGPDILTFKTSIGDFHLVFQDTRTLSFGLPPNTVSGLRFQVSPEVWRRTEQGGDLKTVRNLAYQTNSEVVKNELNPRDGGYSIEFLVKSDEGCAVTLHISNKIDLRHETKEFTAARDAARRRWLSWFDEAPPVSEHYQKTYAYAWWVMGTNLVSPSGRLIYEAMTPSKISYVGSWLWDSAMHTLAYRHTDPELARNQIRVMLSSQLPDGMLPDAIYDEGVVFEIDHPIRAEVTKPPIIAWAAMKLHAMAPDLDFLKEIYVPLVRWNAWWFSMNDDDVDGLAQYNHPYSSGLDNNPLWDQGMPVESPDLNTYLCVQMGSLALIAEALGMDNEAQMWRRRARAIVIRMVEHFWDNEVGVFRAMYHEQPIQVITPFNLYPLWTGQLPEEIKNRLIEHLHDPEMFWGKYALPSVAYNDPHYDPENMWRGPVWANINYFFIEALEQIGEVDLAHELRQKTLDLIMSQPSIYEYYNAETGKPAEKAANIFGWTAAAFIDLALQVTAEEEGRELEEFPMAEL